MRWTFNSASTTLWTMFALKAHTEYKKSQTGSSRLFHNFPFSENILRQIKVNDGDRKMIVRLQKMGLRDGWVAVKA